MLCERLRLFEDFDFQRLAKETCGLVGRDLWDLTSLAFYQSIRGFCETTLIPLSTNSPETAVISQLDDLGRIDTGQVSYTPGSVSISVPVAAASSSGLG